MPDQTPTTPAPNLSKRQRAVETAAAFNAQVVDSSQPVGTGREQALSLFHRVRTHVPAYARFLAAQGVRGEDITSVEAFQRLPFTNKRNYHLHFSLPELCWNGRLEDCDMLAVSSGSTGEPTVWPRFIADEINTVRRFEQVLVEGFGAGSKRTLAVVCFALGSWVGGMFTTSACRQLAAKGYPLTVVTPGNNVAEILRIVPKLAPLFDQVVLLGYPPFIKDVLDRGAAAGVPWEQYSVKLVLAGEVFSESWRDLVLTRVGQPPAHETVASLYGTADSGVLANETPASVLVRRALAAEPDVARKLFGQARLPTLCQYDPRHRFFEAEGGELSFTSDGGIPLVRYNILDSGGLIAHDAMSHFLDEHGLSTEPLREALARFRLPFVYVFGRNNFAVSFYGANVYPENIAPGLEVPHLADAVTGKFVLEVCEGAQHESVLCVTLELVPGRESSEPLRTQLASSVTEQLLKINSEFAHYVPNERREVEVRLLPFAEPDYFPSGVKHRYTR